MARIVTRASLATLALAALVGALPSVASANRLLDRARRELERAEFEDALRTFDRAAASDGLSRREVIQLLEGRALAHLALGDIEALRVDTVQLASLDPGHGFAREVPPEIVESFQRAVAEMQGPLRVEVTWEDAGGGLVAVATVSGDAGQLVREVRVFTRTSAELPWQRSGPRATIFAEDPGAAEAYAEAIGPGGAVVATAGTPESPLNPPPSEHVLDRTEDAEQDDGGTSPWLWVGIGGAAVAIAVVAVLVATSGGGQAESTKPDFPTVIGF